MKLSVTIHSFLVVILLFSGACGTSGLSVSDPHIYNNSFDEVINSVDTALKRAEMRAMESKRVDDTTYFVRYYQTNYDLNERNPESALTADLTIKKLDDNRVQVKIKEEEQPDMIPGEYRLHLARDVYRELNPILNLVVEQEN